MRSFSGLILAATVAAITPVLSSTAFADKRVALLIGNSGYQKVQKLPNPANDAQSVGNVLRAAGFDVVDIQRDMDASGLRRVLRDFSQVTRDADVAVVFYAGHGMEFEGNNYLIPTDAKLESDFDIEDETVSLERVLKVIEPAKRLRLVILDACRDNPFVASMKRTLATRSLGRGLAKVEPTTSDTLIAFAAKAGSTAEDGGGPHSPFTSALLKHLPAPGLDVRFAFGRVRDDVWKSTGHRQEPFLYGSLGGDTISIVPARPEPSLPATSTGPAADEIAWDLVRGSKEADQLRRFVGQFPNSPRRADAEQRIAALEGEAGQEPKRTAVPEIERRQLAAQRSAKIVLITEQEAKLPGVPTAGLSFRAGVTRGPKVLLLSPEASNPAVTSPVHLQLKFETFGGAKIDPSSIKFTYLKSPAVDLTDRLKPMIQSGGVDIDAAEMPPGVHHIRVDLKDTSGRSGVAVFNLNVH